MITREDYMNGKATFSEFYSEIVKEIGITFKDPAQIARFKNALKTDEHMNNIPLDWWDNQAAAVMLYKNALVRRVLKERGDFYSLATGVCIMKTAARIAVEQQPA